ncbi:DUF1203 domain-containing protein [Streptomyces sp. 796.1]|uniref:DUF1203 domain-containing protein n=1 Tax=Streptomyces sp. 796.1 TaxID=3163029 RepID=UPI0039C929F7
MSTDTHTQHTGHTRHTESTENAEHTQRARPAAGVAPDSAAAAPRYEIRAIAPDVVSALRVRDDAGEAPRTHVSENGGTPLRCCLGRSEPGERMLLVSYAPLRRWAAETGADPGAYDEVGPVFIHPEPCGGWTPDAAAAGRYPEPMRGERRVLRAYGATGQILGGRLLIEGSADHGESVEEALATWYEDPRVAAVHIRAVEFGCFHAETRRVGSAGAA